MGRPGAGQARLREAGRGEDDPAAPRQRRGLPHHVPRRGQHRVAHPSPQRRRHHRPRGGVEHALHGARVDQRRLVVEALRGVQGRGTTVPHPLPPPHRRRCVRGSPRRARAAGRGGQPAQRGAPRRVAAERAHHGRRGDQGHRLRHRQGDGPQRRGHRHRDAQGQGAVHRARAGAQQERRPSRRSVGDRHHPLPLPGGPAPLRGQERSRHPQGAQLRPAAAALAGERAARGGAGGDDGAHALARSSVPERARHAARAGGGDAAAGDVDRRGRLHGRAAPGAHGDAPQGSGGGDRRVRGARGQAEGPAAAPRILPRAGAPADPRSGARASPRGRVLGDAAALAPRRGAPRRGGSTHPACRARARGR